MYMLLPLSEPSVLPTDLHLNAILIKRTNGQGLLFRIMGSTGQEIILI
jgi:hypothetical protein